MNETIYITFACIGMMFILKYGTILQGFRDWLTEKDDLFGELFSCSLCLGFWVGVLLGLAGGYWLLPFYSAAVCWITDVVFDIIICKYQK